MHLNSNKSVNFEILLYGIVMLVLLGITGCADSEDSKKRKHYFVNVSMLNLVANSEMYSGKVVQTVAYLNIDGGQLTAYPSRESYLARDNMTAFSLDMDPRVASKYADVFKDRYCMIEGRVSILDEPYYEFIKLGKLTDVKIYVDTDSPRNDPGSKGIYIDKLKYKQEAERNASKKN